MDDGMNMAGKGQSACGGQDPGEQDTRVAALAFQLREEIGKRERAEKISRTVFEIAAHVNQVTGLDDLYRAIHRSLANIIDVTNFFIALYHKEQDVLTFPYFVDELDSFKDYGRFNLEHLSQSNLLSAEVIKTGKALLIHKKEAIEYSLARGEKLPGTPAEVWLGVPLKIKNEMMGVICIQSYHDPQYFTEKDIDLMVSVSDQVAIAIDSKRANEEAQRLAAQTKLLYDVSRRVGGQIKMEDLLPAIVVNIQEAFHYSSVAIALIQEREQTLVFRAVAGDYRDIFHIGDRIKIGQGLTGWTAQTGQTQICGNVRLNPRYIRAATENTQSELVVPLREGSKVTGVLDIQSDDCDAFDATDVSVLETLSTQIAAAIENARLFEDSQRRAERLTVINRVGNMAATAQSLEMLLSGIYEEIKPIFKPVTFFIAFYLKQTAELEFRYLMVEEKRRDQRILPVGNGLSAKIIADQKPLIINHYDREAEPRKLPRQMLLDHMGPAQSWIGVPLWHEAQLIGIANIQSYTPHAWNQEDQQLFFTIADQIGAIIQKTRFYEALQQELSERKKAEEEKKQLEMQLRHAHKMEAIGTLAGGIAHDFNNVLYPIIGFAEMTMDMVSEDSEIRKNVREIFMAAERARELVQQILTFSRQQEIKPKPLYIQWILKEALKLLRSTMPASISIIQNIDETCGPILADSGQIHQMILNLCANAYHAMRQQGGVLEIELSKKRGKLKKIETALECEPDSGLCLTVRDTGHGIDPKIMDRIFDPYFTTKSPGEGTGMGLAMVHGIIKNYGGEITVESQPGQGSIFRIFFPCLREKTVRTEILEKKTGGGRGERVLFVDDEEQISRMVKQMMERLGYHAIIFNQSKAALDAFRQQPDQYHLVITDQTMPQMTGMDLSKKLLEIRPDIPIILCTGFSEIINEEQAKAAGIRKFIMKPIAKHILAQIIRETLDEP